jgi:hypothetical protein
VLDVKGPSYALVVKCLGESGNEGAATALPEFSGDDDDDDDDWQADEYHVNVSGPEGARCTTP